MNKYLYEKTEVELIQHLMNNKPKKIWWDFISYIFEYETYYISLDCSDERAASQNDFDEAIIAKLIKVEKKFIPLKNAKLVCENKAIDNVSIVRTLLFFSTYKSYSKTEKIKNQLGHIFRKFFTKQNNSISKLISTSNGQSEEIISNPDNQELNDLDKQYTNLIDVGLLLEIDGQYLDAFIRNNGFGFNVWEDKYFTSFDSIKDESNFYQFIKVKKRSV